MEEKLYRVSAGCFWSIVASRLNTMTKNCPEKRTNRYTAQLIREYWHNTYRPCPNYLYHKLNQAVYDVKQDLLSKGMSV